MDMQNYIETARLEGYNLQFTGIGMAYITYGPVMLTEVMDTEKAETQLALIGMAIINDSVRKMLEEGR